MSTRKRRATSPKAKTKKPASTPPKPAVGTASDLASPEEPSVVRSIFQTKTSKKDGKQYLLEDSFPCFAREDLWNIMIELGFCYRSGFRNPEWGIQTFDHEDELRQFMVKNGIPPNTHSVLEEKVHRDALKRWIAFAFVPLKTLEAPAILKKVAVPTDYQALTLLLQLGFKIGKKGKIHREEEEFDSIQEVRDFVRMTDSDALLSAASKDEATPRKRARRSTATRKEDMLISDEDLLALRMWAALSPSLLPGEEEQIGDEEEEEEEDNKAESASEESSDEEDSKKPPAGKVKKDKKQSAKKKGGEIEQSTSAAQRGFLTPEECSETDSDAANPSQQGNSCIIL